jgi:hypothetical protein
MIHRLASPLGGCDARRQGQFLVAMLARLGRGDGNCGILAGAVVTFSTPHDANESCNAGAHGDRAAQTRVWSRLGQCERGSSRFFGAMEQASYDAVLTAFHGVAQDHWKTLHATPASRSAIVPGYR